MKKLRLDIGAGAFKRGEEFTSVDLHVDADIRAPMWEIPLPEGVVHEIWSSHALEHVAMAKVPVTLAEWFRILRPGGRLIVQVPNFDYVARYWLTGGDRAWAEAMVFGNQAHDGEFHHCAFSASTLKADLEGAGFTVERIEMRWSHSQETLQGVARKPMAPALTPAYPAPSRTEGPTTIGGSMEAPGEQEEGKEPETPAADAPTTPATEPEAGETSGAEGEED